MEGAYLNKISFKDLILEYLIEEIIKEEKGEVEINDLHISFNDVIIHLS